MSKPFVSLKTAAEAKVPGISKETNFQVNPAIVEIEPGFNRPISRENVDQFKSSIRSGAIIPSIFVRVDAGRIIMVDGEHRLIAVRELIAEGVEILSMSATQFRGNDADRVAHLLTSSQGKPLTPLESGLQYLKLIRFGWDRKKIADRVGRSVTHVDQNIMLAESDSDVQAAVMSGDVSGTVAVAVVKKHGSEAGKVIADGIAKAKSSGKGKMTAATVKSKTQNEIDAARYRRLCDHASFLFFATEMLKSPFECVGDVGKFLDGE